MAKINENVVISTSDASKVTKKVPLKSHHITTQSFLRPSPIMAVELFPNRKITQSVNSFCRLDPLPRPVLSRAKVFNRAFFVPYRTVYTDFTEFVTSTPVAYDPTDPVVNVPDITPSVSNNTFLKLLIDHSSPVQGNASYDFKIANSVSQIIPDGSYAFSPKGVFIYKVLRSLGYNPIFNQGIADGVGYSALPLLSYIKVILDWYYPSAYAHSQVFAYWETVFTSHSIPDINSAISASALSTFFSTVAYCSYEPDYFVSSWDNPVGPNSAIFESSYQINDITVNTSIGVRSIVTNNNSGYNTPVVSSSNNSANASRFSQYVDDALKSLTDYTKRHQLAGVRALDRYLAEFGISLNAELMKRSYYLGFDSFELNFYDVMSHADTSDASLGDFAGKSFANHSKQFGYHAEEYGMFIIINSVIPQLSTYQGTNRHVFHRMPLDFYRGDFDKLGVQAINKSELYVPKDGGCALMASGFVNGVYSFISRYAEYQSIPDLVTGRFECDSQNLDLQGYYQGRDCSLYNTTTPADFVHNLDFVLAGDYEHYNNIFYNLKAVEPIVFSHDFVTQFEDSSLPIWDDYEFENNYRQVKENINGTTVN